MNLFSVFDPTSYFMLSMKWLIIIILIGIFPVKYYLVNSGIFLLFKMMYLYVSEMFKEISFPKHLGVNFLCLVTFLYLIIGNLLSLFPFVFTVTAHPLFTMALGVVMWLAFFIMGWFNNLIISAAHLVPEGSPMLLSPVMVLIESISHLIRPFTLSIRLAANMMSGHLIIGLISSVSMINISSMLLSIMFQSILLLLEFGVAIIQGFVFSILLLLYALEYY